MLNSHLTSLFVNKVKHGLVLTLPSFLFTFLPVVQTQSQPTPLPRGASTSYQCGILTIASAPLGYVPVGYTNVPSCPSTGVTYNATLLALAQSGQTVCGVWGTSTTPSGHSPVAYVTSSPNCNAFPFVNINATVIETPRSGLTICGVYSQSATPPGYSPVYYLYSNICNKSLGFPNATVIEAPRSGLTICGVLSQSSIPQGYVLSSYVYSSACLTSNVGNTFNNATVIQSSSDPPPGTISPPVRPPGTSPGPISPPSPTPTPSTDFLVPVIDLLLSD